MNQDQIVVNAIQECLHVSIALGEGAEDGRGRGGERGWDGIGLDGRKDERRDK